ncbi:MAG TPA: hypothetical protein VGR82_17705 [Methylomirabilota bacterium]|jgi:hypothetical protein|nr:hypothetical protein [Methylomirabilota bacterium]
MPGPVSDSYDPEFGTSANAQDVHDAIQHVVDRIGVELGPTLMQILEVVHSDDDVRLDIVSKVTFSRRELRIIRFACNRALESL